jgi:GNAT superfamily N-acetyltransferase
MASKGSSEGKVTVREAKEMEFSNVADCFRLMWLDNAVKPEELKDNWYKITTDFLEAGKRDLGLSAAVAVTEEGRIIGTSICQLFTGPFPAIIIDETRKDGYIWAVYVDPQYRGRGVAKQLVSANIQHLKSLGCTHALLNATESGRPVYERLGFLAANSMRLDLRKI